MMWPTMTTDVGPLRFAPCCVCGKASDDLHHEPPKGAGGAPEWIGTLIPLCRLHHQERHTGQLSFKVDNGIVTGYLSEVQIFERAVGCDDLSPDPRYWSDEQLCHAWAEAESQAMGNLIRQCEVAWQFWRRYGWADKWYERAAQMLTDYTGTYVHWRRVYERVRLYERFNDRWQDYELLGANLSIAVAESHNPEALEIAVAAKEKGLRVSDAVALVKGKEPEDRVPCDACGGKGWTRKETS